MPCDNCECPFCRADRERQEHKALANQLCQAWNWNNHPIEIAQQIKKLYQEHGEEFIDILYAEIATFFSRETADQIEEYAHYV